MRLTAPTATEWVVTADEDVVDGGVDVVVEGFAVVEL